MTLTIANPEAAPAQAASPACESGCFARVLAASDTREAELARRLAAFAEGGRQARADIDSAWVAGYAQCAADVKAAQHAIYGELAREAESDRLRWTLRGEVRTRETFAAPHPSDYLGGPVVWAPRRAEGFEAAA